MRTVDIDPATAEDALVLIAEHVPPHVVIGRPILATLLGAGAVLIVTDAGNGWTVRPGEVEQALADTDGHSAILVWSGGRLVNVITKEG